METSPDNHLYRKAGPANPMEARLGATQRQVDAGGDEMTNAAEFMAGTDPLDRISRLAVTTMSAGPGGLLNDLPDSRRQSLCSGILREPRRVVGPDVWYRGHGGRS